MGNAFIQPATYVEYLGGREIFRLKKALTDELITGLMSCISQGIQPDVFLFAAALAELRDRRKGKTSWE